MELTPKSAPSEGLLPELPSLLPATGFGHLTSQEDGNSVKVDCEELGSFLHHGR